MNHRIAHYLALIERENYELIVVNARVLFYIYIFHSLEPLSCARGRVTMKSRMIREGDEVLNRVDRHKITHNKYNNKKAQERETLELMLLFQENNSDHLIKFPQLTQFSKHIAPSDAIYNLNERIIFFSNWSGESFSPFN